MGKYYPYGVGKIWRHIGGKKHLLLLFDYCRPTNAFVSLSSFIAFTEGYLGLWPTIALWTKFFCFKRQVIPDKGNPNKELTPCGAASISPRRGSILPRVTGLESCKLWQRTFFYVRNTTDKNLIGLPAFVIGPPACTNWGRARRRKTGRSPKPMPELRRSRKRDFAVMTWWQLSSTAGFSRCSTESTKSAT